MSRGTALALLDAGAQSPKETWLRLLLIDAGLPKPRTQIRVSDGFNEALIDMGYDEPKVGLDYEGTSAQYQRRGDLKPHRHTSTMVEVYGDARDDAG